MAAESQVKASIVFDTSQMQEGVQTSVEGLKQMAAQAEVTSTKMMSKSQAMAEAARVAASQVSEADMKVAASSRLASASKLQLVKTTREIATAQISEADKTTLLAAAQRNARQATVNLAEAQSQLAAAFSSKGLQDVIERLALRSVGYIAAATGIRDIGAALKDAVTSSLDFGEAISRTSEKTGLSVQTLSVLHYAAATTGGDFDGMAKAVSRLDKNIGAAADGNIQMSGLFHSLGLNAKELAGNTDGASIALRHIATVLANTEGPRRQQLAMELLGKSGADQIPMLIELGTHWDETTRKTSEAGVMLNGQTAGALEATNERMKEMSQTVDGAKIAFTEGLTPGLNAFLSSIGRGAGSVSIFTSLGRDMVSMLNGATAAAFKVGQSLDVIRAYTYDLGVAKDRAKDLAAAQREGAAAAAALSAAQNPTKGATPTPSSDIAGGQKAHSGGTDGWKGSDLPGVAAAAAAAVRKADTAKLHAMEDGRQQQEQEGFLSIKLDHDYWAARINTFKEGSDEYRAIQEKITRDDVEGARQAHAQIAKFQATQKSQSAADPAEQEHVARSIAAETALVVAQAEKAVGAQQSMAMAAAKTTEAYITQSFALGEEKIKLAEVSGELTPLGAAEARQALHAQEAAQKLKVLRDELKALQNLAQSEPAGQTDASKKASAGKIAELQAQIAQLQGQTATQGTKDQANVQTTMARPYLQAFDQINNGWLGMQNKLIQGQGLIGEDFRRMGLGMVESMARNAEQMIATHARMEIQKLIASKAASAAKIALHMLTGTTIAAQKVALAATGQAALSAANVAQVISYSGVAGAAAAASTAAIPFVGAALAVPAGASVAAGVAGAFTPLAAFEKGGVVGGSYRGGAVHILAHAGERVLTTAQTDTLHRILNNGANPGGDTHFHMGGNTIHGGSADAPTVNDRQFVKTVQRLQRQGSLAPARQSILG